MSLVERMSTMCLCWADMAWRGGDLMRLVDLCSFQVCVLLDCVCGCRFNNPRDRMEKSAEVDNFTRSTSLRLVDDVK
jgi:hypothetical protein